MTTWLRNAWYVAGFADEFVPDRHRWRARCSAQPLALFRTAEGGALAALADRCPHRFAPLSAGKVCDRRRSIECPYHGLRFDADGRCVHNPHGDGRDPKARTRCARTWCARRDRLVWLWAGDAASADESLIPDYSRRHRARRDDASVRGYMPTACDAPTAGRQHPRPHARRLPARRLARQRRARRAARRR